MAGDEFTERRFVDFVERVAQLVRSQQFLANTGAVDLAQFANERLALL